MRALAKEYSLSVATISERCSKEKWKEAAARIATEAEQQIIAKTIDALSSNAELAEYTITTLMKKIAASADVIEPGDTQSAKQLSACLKDLKELEAFVVKPHDSSIKVELAAELDDLAD